MEILNKITLYPWFTTLQEKAKDSGWIKSEQIPSINPKTSTMSIVFWNYRGARHPDFLRTAKDLVAIHKPLVFIITETRLRGSDALNIIDKLPFDKWEDIDVCGLRGGIWLFWDSKAVILNNFCSTEQEIHGTIKRLPGQPRAAVVTVTGVSFVPEISQICYPRCPPPRSVVGFTKKCSEAFGRCSPEPDLRCSDLGFPPSDGLQSEICSSSSSVLTSDRWSCVGCILSLSDAEMAAEVEVGQLGKSPAANQGLPNSENEDA
ncbi:hypothetical protein COLO4_37466 [Corchorus olitorius]|uniref:Endonuclease/exonuclease/phosphatase n=1 Tax=Corchorus olitorius TaxID=93759 RepID=A0A1R3G1F9_9ROSI|nr:hypothetical protein COLO4_37466 [Corchorus olitorius]